MISRKGAKAQRKNVFFAPLRLCVRFCFWACHRASRRNVKPMFRRMLKDVALDRAGDSETAVEGINDEIRIDVTRSDEETKEGSLSTFFVTSLLRVTCTSELET